MHNLQSIKRKLFTLVFFSLGSGLSVAFGQQENPDLTLPDSLFQAKRYTQSFDLYHEILFGFKKASPGMLLKMAYIKEGLGNYSEALYYLNLFYLKTLDKSVLKKMEELAEKHRLRGYDYSDAEFFLTLYYKYYNLITLVIISLALFMAAVVYYQKFKLKQRPYFAGITLVLVCALLFYLVNFGKEYNQGIVARAGTHLMAGPSAGAEPVEIIDPGHRVKILGYNDVWTRIEWNDKEVFVKRKNLLPVRL